MTPNKTKLSSLGDLVSLNSEYYKGNLKDYQLHGNSFKGSQYHEANSKLELSPYQNKLYLIALYGCAVLTPEEVNNIPYSKKEKIQRQNKHAQNVLNWYKQEVANKFLNLFFDTFFPKSKITEEITKTKYSKPHPLHKSTIDLKSLRITKLEIINLFIENRILPTNFMVIKEENQKTGLLIST